MCLLGGFRMLFVEYEFDECDFKYLEGPYPEEEIRHHRDEIRKYKDVKNVRIILKEESSK
jgi:hypothetical protein